VIFLRMGSHPVVDSNPGWRNLGANGHGEVVRGRALVGGKKSEAGLALAGAQEK